MNTYEIRITLNDDQDEVLKGIVEERENRTFKGSIQSYLQARYSPIIMDLIDEQMFGVLEELAHREKPCVILGKLKRLGRLEGSGGFESLNRKRKE